MCREMLFFSSHHLQLELIVLYPHWYDWSGWSYCHAAFCACVPHVTQTSLFSHDDDGGENDDEISFLLICWSHCDSWWCYCAAVSPVPQEFVAALDALRHSIHHQQPLHHHHYHHCLVF